ncbi:MAG: energy transducer TonB, partial [Moraxella sp.]|nr:energy transducer TonB [Moraxella sp.]
MAYKDSQSYHFSTAAPRRDITLPMAIAIALGVHVLVIFGISFSTGQTPAEMAQEVATVLTQNMQENENARFIANASQEGSGQVRQQLRLETNDLSPATAEEMQDTQDILNLQKQIRQQQYQQSYLRTTLSIRHTKSENDNKTDKEQDDLIAQEERIRKQIQTLEAQLSQKQQVFASKTKIETVDSNSTTHGKAASYLENFRQHVERVANQYYPEQARLQNITGDVRLMVVINEDGSVKAIRLLESSGSAILDEAAKQSVRQSAPYGGFDKDMRDILELRVIRTWRYSDQIEVTF